MSHPPLAYHRLSASAYAALQDAARERALQLRAEAIGAAAAWLAHVVADAVGQVARRLHARSAARRQRQRATVRIA